MSFYIQGSYYPTMALVFAEVDRIIGRCDQVINDPDVDSVSVAAWTDYRADVRDLYTKYGGAVSAVFWPNEPELTPVCFDIGSPASRVHVAENGSLSTQMYGRFFPENNYDGHVFSIKTNGSRGSAVITNPESGTIYYAPDLDATGDDEVDVEMIVDSVGRDGKTTKVVSIVGTIYLEIS